MEFMVSVCIALLIMGWFGLLCIIHYCINWRDDRIADLEDDIKLLKSNRRIARVMDEDGHILYFSAYEQKHYQETHNGERF